MNWGKKNNDLPKTDNSEQLNMSNNKATDGTTPVKRLSFAALKQRYTKNKLTFVVFSGVTAIALLAIIIGVAGKYGNWWSKKDAAAKDSANNNTFANYKSAITHLQSFFGASTSFNVFHDNSAPVNGAFYYNSNTFPSVNSMISAGDAFDPNLGNRFNPVKNNSSTDKKVAFDNLYNVGKQSNTSDGDIINASYHSIIQHGKYITGYYSFDVKCTSINFPKNKGFDQATIDESKSTLKFQFTADVFFDDHAKIVGLPDNDWIGTGINKENIESNNVDWKDAQSTKFQTPQQSLNSLFYCSIINVSPKTSLPIAKNSFLMKLGNQYAKKYFDQPQIKFNDYENYQNAFTGNADLTKWHFQGASFYNSPFWRFNNPDAEDTTAYNMMLFTNDDDNPQFSNNTSPIFNNEQYPTCLYIDPNSGTNSGTTDDTNRINFVLSYSFTSAFSARGDLSKEGETPSFEGGSFSVGNLVYADANITGISGTIDNTGTSNMNYLNDFHIHFNDKDDTPIPKINNYYTDNDYTNVKRNIIKVSSSENSWNLKDNLDKDTQAVSLADREHATDFLIRYLTSRLKDINQVTDDTVDFDPGQLFTTSDFSSNNQPTSDDKSSLLPEGKIFYPNINFLKLSDGSTPSKSHGWEGFTWKWIKSDPVHNKDGVLSFQWRERMSTFKINTDYPDAAVNPYDQGSYSGTDDCASLSGIIYNDPKKNNSLTPVINGPKNVKNNYVNADNPGVQNPLLMRWFWKFTAI